MSRITLRVHPRSSHPRLTWDGTTVEVWVTAPAVDGRATRAALAAVAAWAGVPPSSVRLVSGERSRTKVVEMQGGVMPPGGS